MNVMQQIRGRERGRRRKRSRSRGRNRKIAHAHDHVYGYVYGPRLRSSVLSHIVKGMPRPIAL